MTATYGGNPASSDKDKVRFLLHDNQTNGQDTTVINPMLSDEEIAYLLTEYPNPYQAASEGAYSVSAAYTNRADKTIGPLSIKYSDQSDRWSKLGDALGARAGRRGALAITTQVTRERPIFRIGMNDNGGYPYMTPDPTTTSQP